jgi:hypothetical protein
VATKLNITFVTSSEANKHIEEQLCKYIAKSLLNNLEFRKEIGLEVEEAIDHENGVE